MVPSIPPAQPPASGEKAVLRREAGDRRAGAKAASPHAGLRLSAVFPDSLLPVPGAVVAGYRPIRGEIDPLPLMRRLAARGVLLALPAAAVALPAQAARGDAGALTFRLWREGDALVRGGLGVPGPGMDAPVVEPALVLVPLLAFDGRGGRLGYGGGWYDRTLAGLRARGPMVAIGLAFAAQEVERVPVEPHDAPLDGIATERAYIAVNREF